MLLEPPAPRASGGRAPRPGRSCASANSRTGAPSEYQPAGWPWSSTKRPRRASEPEDLGRAIDPERLAQLRREALERGDDAHELLDAGGFVGEDLGGEIREQRPTGPADPVERLSAAGGWDTAQGLDGEPDRRRPPARRAMELGRRLRVVVARQRPQQLGGLLDVEREVRAAELEHLALPAQPLDRERRLEARREDDVEPRRRLPAEGLDQLHRARRPGQLVDVVHDEHEVATKLCLQRLRHERRDALRACPIVRLRVGARSARRRRPRSPSAPAAPGVEERRRCRGRRSRATRPRARRCTRRS